MAIGTYVGQGGSVRDLKACYVGQGGSVRTVDAIYVGQGGSVRLVWPPYIYDNGTFSSLGGGMNFNLVSGAYPQVSSQSTYILVQNVSSGYSSISSGLTGAYCSSSIDMSLYKTLSMTYTITQLGISSTTATTQRLYIGGCTSRPYFSSSYSPVMTTQGTDYSNYISINASLSTNTTYTLSLDVSSITSGLYVYIGYRAVNASASNIQIRITRIEVSA